MTLWDNIKWQHEHAPHILILVALWAIAGAFYGIALCERTNMLLCFILAQLSASRLPERNQDGSNRRRN